MGILDSTCNVVARYAYDTGGKLLRITDGSRNDVSGSTSHIGYRNPMRHYGTRGSVGITTITRLGFMQQVLGMMTRKSEDSSTRIDL